jgi:Tripartite tricarboxylate transporter TctB family
MNSKSRFVSSEMFVPVGTLIVGLVAMVQSGSIRVIKVNDTLGPRLLPRVVALVIIVCSVWLIIEQVRQSDRRGDDTAERPASEATQTSIGTKRLVVSMFIACCYLVALPLLGYLVSTAITASALAFALGSRSFLHLIGVPVAVALILTWVFGTVLGVRLP